MAKRTLNKLSAAEVRSIHKPGRHSDGGGLYLYVSDQGNKSWAFVFTRRGKKRELGLGALKDTTLAQAREKAVAYRAEIAAGRDPTKLRARQAEPTFGELALDYIASMETGWRNPKHRAQWRSTLETYAARIWETPISSVETDDVLQILKPIWATKPETASRVRGRIERVVEFANASGKRSWAPNPAAWKGHLRALLPPPNKLSRGHHAAMRYEDVPAFMQRLRLTEGLSARGLELLILTVARTGEIIGATLDEFDTDGLWIVPASRMKGNREHRVPLSTRAMEIVRELRDSKVNEYLLPGDRKGRPLSNMSFTMLMRRMDVGHYTPHGFRSSFRDWCGDRTTFPREMAEAALAHRLGDKTEAAYRRSDALEKRRKLMQSWQAYLSDKRPENVVPITRTK